MINPIPINVQFTSEETFNCSLSDQDVLICAFDELFSPDEYTGETTITPSTETQTLETANKLVKENITVNPIPSYYGLITWDGSTITVS